MKFIFTDTDDIMDTGSFDLFPNPNDGRFTLMANNVTNSKVKFSIYDALGRKVFLKIWRKQNQLKESINLQFLPKGNYHYRFEMNNKLSDGVVRIE